MNIPSIFLYRLFGNVRKAVEKRCLTGTSLDRRRLHIKAYFTLPFSAFANFPVGDSGRDFVRPQPTVVGHCKRAGTRGKQTTYLPLSPLHLPVDGKVVEPAQHEHCAAKPEGDSRQVSFHKLLVISGDDPHITKHRAPDGRTEQCEKREEPVIHFHDAGGY